MEIPCAIKKQPGILSHDSTKIQWTSSQGGATESVLLSEIQGMQATPPTAAKRRIKLSSKDGKSIMLEFADSNQLESARNGLQAIIKSHREQTTQATTENHSTETSPPSIGTSTPGNQPAKQGTPVAKKGGKRLSLEPAKLLQNLDLQRTVLRQDAELMRTFQQVVISSGALTNEQFWSLRMHLLVTAAQQQLQARGSYNVLSTIKPTIGSDNRVNINLTREKIADVFDQYPLVRKAYNANVPKMSEGEFWQRFFMSKLFLVLRGEKVSQTHSPDAVFDPYIDILYELQEKQRARREEEDSEHPAPLFINVEANAENNPETYGNNLVVTAGKGTRGLIRSMNGLSHRLLLGKRKQRDQSDSPQPAGPEEMEAELKLRDLATKSSEDDNIDLHLQLGVTEETRISKGNLEQTVVEICGQIPQSVSLDETLDSILSGDARADQYIIEHTPHDDSLDSVPALSSDLQLTQATSMEFLRHFWNAYMKSPSEAASLREYLVKSKERIRVVDENGYLGSIMESLDEALAAPI